MVKNRVAVIIPTFNTHSLLKEHLRLLRKQRFRNFDAIIIDSGDSKDHNFIRPRKGHFGIIVKYFKDDLGGSGSVHEGMKYAYEKGYQHIMLSDSDAFPVSPNLIGELVKNADATTATYGTNILKRYKDKAGPESENIRWAPFHYLNLTRETIERIGYPRRDFFIYNDDIEYSNRITKRFAILQLNHVYYKHLNSTLTTYFSKGMSARASYYTIRNRLLTSPNITGRVSVMANSFVRALLAAYTIDREGFLRYWQFLLQGLYDGLAKRSGARIIPKIELGIEFKSESKYPKNAIYLTYPNRDTIMGRHKMARGWGVVDISNGISNLSILRMIASGRQIVVNDYLANQQVTTRLSPFLFMGRLYILTENRLLRVTKKKPP